MGYVYVPFNFNDVSGLFVNEHSNWIAPCSNIGSLAGENSNSKLHNVDDATVRSSSHGGGILVNKAIKGRQTEWS